MSILFPDIDKKATLPRDYLTASLIEIQDYYDYTLAGLTVL